MAPQRSVTGNVVISHRTLSVRISAPSSARYVRSKRWTLYGIADCDVYASVEGYIPTMPTLHHTYDSPEHMQAGGMDFYVDTWVETTNPVQPLKVEPLEAFLRAHGYAVPPAIRSGSDQQHVVALLRAKGYRLPDGMMSVRFVHLLDDRRNDLMVIYSEDLAPTGLSVKSLRKGGSAFDRWPQISASLVRRAESRVKISAPHHNR